jgi:predicted amidophosphoribosyltransferase
MPLWKKFDQAAETFPVRLEPTDVCYYAREYISGVGYKGSECNQLISNFKKPTAKRANHYEWQHKVNAMRKFAEELARALRDGTQVACIPTSKCRTDPDYDSRLDDTLRLLGQKRPTLKIVQPFHAIQTLQAAHLGGDRNIEAFYRNLAWDGGLTGNLLVLIDDVITTGSHFKACQRKIQEYQPGFKVVGVFWAKTVWPDP